MKTRQLIKYITINTLLGLPMGHAVSEDSFLLSANVLYRYPNLQIVDTDNDHPHIATGLFPNLDTIASRSLVDSSIKKVFLNIQRDYYLMPAAFADTQNLRLADLGGTLNIPNNCFENCSNLKVVWGQKTRTIGDNAFKGCLNLELIYLPNVNQISQTAFTNANIIYIIVPQILIKAVKHQNPNAQVLAAENYKAGDLLTFTDI